MLGWGRLSQPGGGPWGGPQPTQQCALFGPPILNRREEKGRTTAAKSSQITNPQTGERREAGVNVTRASSTLEEAQGWGPSLTHSPRVLLATRQISGVTQIGIRFPSHRWGFLSFLPSLLSSTHSSPPFLFSFNPIHSVEWDRDDILMTISLIILHNSNIIQLFILEKV